MSNIKSSELFSKLIENTRKAALSEDENLINSAHKILNERNIDIGVVELIRNHEEFLNATYCKSIVLTLEEMGVVEKDVDLLDKKVSSELMINGVKSAINSKEKRK